MVVVLSSSCSSRMRVVMVVNDRAVSVKVTSGGYVVSCPGTRVIGWGPTEAAAWEDFWAAVRADWKSPEQDTVASLGGRLPPGLPRWRRVRTIRVRDLFG
ncbi:hypothetical protein OG462_44255 [Streptomyces sp. NBC_01077]|uniref:hypothetical protein n=1 Tax=Streptomyces sp. NBC_01077 TaxID=2903746 RepID=UPI00386B6383|nr:hypothetical protein OG462_00750 [Streptomyces sp. NBC_01077]WSV43725.1 hypothetical protein OG462_44255 [Streptomyces sp. NBC_01077]